MEISLPSTGQGIRLTRSTCVFQHPCTETPNCNELAANRFGLPFSVKGPIARSSLRTGVVLAMRLAVQTGTLLLVARMLGAQQFGAFAAVAAVAVMFGSLSTFGMQLVLLRDVSRDGSGGMATFRVALPFTMLCSGAVFLVFLGMSLLRRGEGPISVETMAAIGAAEIILIPLLGLGAAAQHGMGRVALSQLTMMMPLAMRLLVALGVSMTEPMDSLSAYARGYLLVTAVALAVSVFAQSRRWPPFKLWRLPDKRTLRTAAGYSVLNFNRTAPRELDKALAGSLLPLEGAGIYSAAARAITAATFPVAAMNLSALPRLLQEHDRKPARSRKLLLTMYASAFGYGILIAACVWMVAPVFPWVFGADYLGIEEAIRLLCLAIPGLTLGAVGNNALMALGRPWARTCVEGIGMGVLTLGALALAGHLGIAGMAIALACSEWTMAFVSGFLVRRHLLQNGIDSRNRYEEALAESGHNDQLAAAPKAKRPE